MIQYQTQQMKYLENLLGQIVIVKKLNLYVYTFIQNIFQKYNILFFQDHIFLLILDHTQKNIVNHFHLTLFFLLLKQFEYLSY